MQDQNICIQTSTLNKPLLEVCGLKKEYAGRLILDDINFSLYKGESIAILGSSGCGKTSLLRLLCGLSLPSVGEVLFKGKVLRKPSLDIAIILQDYGLLPWCTVLENVALGLKIRGIKRKDRLQIATKTLEDLGLFEHLNKFPARLSGGEKQRVAIARAFAQDPALLLMDEPFSSLDAMTRESLQDTVLAEWKRLQLPFVLVTHSVEEAVYLGKRIVLLGKSESKSTKIHAIIENPCFLEGGFHSKVENLQAIRSSEIFFKTIAKVRAKLDV